MSEPRIKKIGKYEILAELGKGAMGVVYKAQDPFLGRLVAIKTMSASLKDDPSLLQRFYREAQSAGNLRHANIVTIYDLGEEDGIPFIAMEFLEGVDLEEVIRQKIPYNLLKKLNIVAQICRGLHYAHNHGIIHRDVKPANVRILPSGEVKIMDFGIARVTGSNMTRTDLVMGTVNYMSPEQIQNPQGIDRRSDLFSVGVILFEFLAGQRPFTGDAIPTILFKIINEPAPALSHYLPGCPAVLESIVQRSLAKKPDHRYAHCEDLAMELDGLMESLKPQVIQDLLEGGQKQLQEHLYEEARQHYAQVLEIDSSHRVAKTILRRIQEEQKKFFQGQQAQKLLEEGKDHLQKNALNEAIQCLESAQQLDPQNTQIQKFLLDAQEKRSYFLKRQEFEKFLNEAHTLSMEGRLEETIERLNSALQIFPTESRANAMRQSVLDEIDLREKRRKVGRLLVQIKSFLFHKQYGEAQGLLDQAFQLDPENRECLELQEFLESEQLAEQRRRQLEERISLINAAIAGHRLADAQPLIQEALQQFPADSRLVRLAALVQTELEEERQRQVRNQKIQEVLALMSRQRFPEAISALEEALRLFPEDPELAHLLNVVQQDQAQAEQEVRLSQELGKVTSLIRERRCREAMVVAEDLARRYPEHLEVRKLHERVKVECTAEDRRQRREALIQKAKQAIQAGRLESAQQELENSRQEFVGDPEIERLFQFVLSEKEVTRRREQLESLQKEARQHLAQGQYAKARLSLEKAQAIEADHPETLRIRQLIDNQEAAASRQTYMSRITAEARGHLKSHRFEQATTLLEKGLQEYPGDIELESLLRLVKNEQEQETRRQRLIYHVQKVTEAIKKQAPEAAISYLAEALKEFPEDAQLQALYRQAREQQEKQQRMAHLQAQIEHIQAVLQQGQFQQAIDQLEKLRADHPENRTLIDNFIARATEAQQAMADASATAAVMDPLNEATSIDLIFPGEKPSTKAPAVAVPARPRRPLPLILAGGGLVCLLLLVGYLWLGSSPAVDLQVVSDAEGAEVLLDGKAAGSIRDGKLVLAQVPPGSHTLEARKDGYQPYKSALEVRKGGNAPFSLSMERLSPMVRIAAGQPGVRVRLDGKEVAVTDSRGIAEIASAPPGRHDLVLTKEGFVDRQKSIELAPGKLLELEESLARKEGGPGVTLPASRETRLEITTNVPDAQVQLGDVPLGRTGPDGRFQMSREGWKGRQVLQIAKDGFETARQEMNIQPGEMNLLTINLAPKKAPGTNMSVLTVSSAPAGAEFFLDEVRVGSTPMVNFPVLPGRHKIVLRREKYRDLEKVLEVHPNTPLAESFVLEKTQGFLEIASNPDGVIASISGVSYDTAVRKRMELDPGNYSVQFSKSGYASKEESVVIRDAQTARLQVTLEKLAEPPVRPPVAALAGPFTDAFITEDEWDYPSAWKVDGILHAKGSGTGLLKDRIYRNFTQRFSLRLANGISAAWLVRATDKQNGYLVQVNGERHPRGNLRNTLFFYTFRDGRTSGGQVFPLPFVFGKDPGNRKEWLEVIMQVSGKTIIVKGSGTVFAGTKTTEKELGRFEDPSGAFPQGKVGFAILGNEEFEITALVIDPQ